ncbi:MAG TPA: hypothetical protein VFE13_05985 [Caulobacteraceae bacterium]|jgi:hypothetical protein|nr:hypothetical protein [Caulobacteraceae bacterium]
MPDDKPAEVAAGAQPITPAGHTHNRLQDFIFARELAEVYLLLDNVSMSTNKRLPPPGDADLIEQICQIGWPPSGLPADLAHQAAILLRARDALNSAAAPATGATIAFTLLVADESGLPLGRGGKDPATPVWAPGVGWGEGQAPSRVSLATMAFPNLRGAARRFQTAIPIVVGALFLLFAATSYLSWDISVGNSALAEWTKAEAAVAEAPDAPTLAAPGTPGAKFPAPTLQQLQVRRDLAWASVNLKHWLQFWVFLLDGPHRLERFDCGAPTCPPGLALNVDERWAGEILNVLGGAVLPTLYGLLGAGAAVVRTMSARIRESLLSPRHLQLTFVQLTLGAVIGGCIGLFVTPSGAPSSAPPGLLGSVPLSASALCFIAGFGVDGVFQALEGLIQRVFNTTDPTKPAKP